MLLTSVRQPGVQVLVNGNVLAGAYEAEVLSNSYLGADRFGLAAALGASDNSMWETVPLQIEVRIGVDGAWQSLITGQVDAIEIDPIRRTIRSNGRDLTALLVAAQTHESFENLTSSDVATLFAGRHGLSVAVAQTTTLIGRYYQGGHTRSALSQHGRATTEWEVLTWLAQQEAYDVWVGGTTLHFQPQDSDLGSTSISPDGCISMQLSRDMTLASGFTIEIKSWDCASKQAVVGQALYGAGDLGASHMIALRPNLSASEAQLLAEHTASQLGAHERLLSYEVPADLTTMPRTKVELVGTNTDFDGIYTICEVERRFSVRHGFTQHVQARRASWTIS